MHYWGWIIGGSAALTGALTMFFGYIRSIWSHIASHLIVSCQVKGNLEEAVSMYCWKKYKTSPYGMRTYLGWTMFVRPTNPARPFYPTTTGSPRQRFSIFLISSFVPKKCSNIFPGSTTERTIPCCL